MDPNAFQKFQSKTTRWNPDNALALAWASDLAYQDPGTTIPQAAATWGFQKPVTVSGPRDIQCTILGNADCIVAAYRGTIPTKEGKFDANNWIVNCTADQISVEDAFGIRGNVHDGFATAFSSIWQPVRDAVNQFQTGSQSVWFTGHSLGGALALMAAAAWTFELRMPFNGLYTYGQPRVGDPDFCGNCDTHFGDQYYRFVNDEDIVTRVPPRLFPHFPTPDVYGHCGRLVYFDAHHQMQNDEHFWNDFLTRFEVGFENMGMLLQAPVADHNLEAGYIANIQSNINNGTAAQMRW